jgi:hypothetical protein
MAAGGRRAGSHVDFGCMHSRPGAGQCRQTVFTGSISVYGEGAAQRLN